MKSSNRFVHNFRSERSQDAVGFPVAMVGLSLAKFNVRMTQGRK